MLVHCPRCGKYYKLPNIEKKVLCHCVESDPCPCDIIKISEIPFIIDSENIDIFSGRV